VIQNFAGDLGLYSTLKIVGMAKMTDTKIPKTLLRLILKWMNNKKTGSLQINFIKGEIDSAFLNFAVSLKNDEDRN